MDGRKRREEKVRRGKIAGELSCAAVVVVVDVGGE
jgi:hypothetical protein